VCCCCYRDRFRFHCRQLPHTLASKLPSKPALLFHQQQRSLLYALNLALESASFFSPAKYLAHLTVISPAPCMKASLTLSVFATQLLNQH
jgi:hypothetical protein